MLLDCKPVTAATKLRSREIISLFEHDLRMLSSCNLFKIAMLCLQTNTFKISKKHKTKYMIQGRMDVRTDLQKKLRIVLRQSS